MSKPTTWLTKPTDKEFDPGAVEWAVFKETATHYTSLGGWGLAFLVGVATLTPGIGIPLAAGIAVTGGFFLLGCGALVVNFAFRDKVFKDKHVRKLLQARRTYDKQLLEQIRADMRREEPERGLQPFERGLREADDLWKAYEALTRLLDDNAHYNDPEATKYRRLADTLYESGAFNLREALELNRSIEARKIDKVRKECAGYETRLRTARVGEDLQHLKEQIELLTGQITDYEVAVKKFNERLKRCNKIEGILHGSAEKLSELGIGRSGTSINWESAASDLSDAVQAAVEADEELQRAVKEHARR